MKKGYIISNIKQIKISFGLGCARYARKIGKRKMKNLSLAIYICSSFYSFFTPLFPTFFYSTLTIPYTTPYISLSPYHANQQNLNTHPCLVMVVQQQAWSLQELQHLAHEETTTNCTTPCSEGR